MKKLLGGLLMLLGVLMLLLDGALVAHNLRENSQAGDESGRLLQEVARDIAQTGADPMTLPATTEMTVREVDGQPCIGYVSLPTVERELPVIAQWSYPALRKAPCRYVGSTFTDNLVIAAHNYNRHFGPITQLSPGDPVYFTDMDGLVTEYAVTDTETLMGTDVEAMTDSPADLTLFTCTYGGRSRITVRCERVL